MPPSSYNPDPIPMPPSTYDPDTAVYDRRSPSAAPPVRTLEGLDADRFAPLGADEAKDFIRRFGSGWRTAYLDSTWVIPPSQLPRIQVIDRGMVAAGLITPGELAEIHDVGNRMAAAKGDWGFIQRQAEQAVARTEQERAERKARKKAEAAERKARRQEEIARRRATDIIHLGRGVSKGLADRRANVEKLQAANLPVLATPADVAKALGVSIGQLRWLAYHSPASKVSHYVRFAVPKKSGGQRMLSAPLPYLTGCQEWILANILTRVPTHDAAHGFVPGRSTVTNASPHVGKDLLVNTDLKDFFPTVTFPRVGGIFRSLGYSPAAATILALLCTASPRMKMDYDGQVMYVATGPRALPQGACTSPALSNLVARGLDARLTGICSKLGWSYTRYADDMTFSADAAAASHTGYLLARVRHIIQDEGFAMNHAKTRVQRRSRAQEVTGIVVNDRPGVPRKIVRRIRAILHRARHEGLDAQNREDLPHFQAWLRGMIAYISMVNPDQGARLWEAWRGVAET